MALFRRRRFEVTDERINVAVINLVKFHLCYTFILINISLQYDKLVNHVITKFHYLLNVRVNAVITMNLWHHVINQVQLDIVLPTDLMN